MHESQEIEMQTRFSPPDLSNAVETFVGPYKLALAYRAFSVDEGLTIHVFGPVDGEEQEILRFDCFKNHPHYHLGFSYLDVPRETIDDPNPFNWALGELAQRFPDYLARARAGSELPDKWQEMTASAAEDFRSKSTDLIPA